MRLKLKHILKKGARIGSLKLENTKEVRELIAETKRQQEYILSIKNQPFVNNVITI